MAVLVIIAMNSVTIKKFDFLSDSTSISALTRPFDIKRGNFDHQPR